MNTTLTKTCASNSFDTVKQENCAVMSVVNRAILACISEKFSSRNVCFSQNFTNKLLKNISKAKVFFNNMKTAEKTLGIKHNEEIWEANNIDWRNKRHYLGTCRFLSNVIHTLLQRRNNGNTACSSSPDQQPLGSFTHDISFMTDFKKVRGGGGRGLPKLLMSVWIIVRKCAP